MMHIVFVDLFAIVLLRDFEVFFCIISKPTC